MQSTIVQIPLSSVHKSTELKLVRTKNIYISLINRNDNYQKNFLNSNFFSKNENSLTNFFMLEVSFSYPKKKNPLVGLFRVDSHA